MKPCKVCGATYQPARPLQRVCGYVCALADVNTKRNKELLSARRKADSLEKKKAKTLTKLLNEAQVYCNRYVRMLEGNNCISCGTKNPNIQYAAGHYRTRKAAPQLRFNLDNIHVQCNHYCNSQLSGNILEYRINLIKRIGMERVEVLECDNTIHRYTRDEAISIKEEFKQMVKQLENKT